MRSAVPSRSWAPSLLSPAAAQTIGPDTGAGAAAATEGLGSPACSGLASSCPSCRWRSPANRTTTSSPVHVAGFESPDGDVAMTAMLRPLDGGRWSIDAMKLPAAGNFTVTLPKTGRPAMSGPMKLSFTLGSRIRTACIDPAFATASTFHTEFGGLDLTSDNPKQHQEAAHRSLYFRREFCSRRRMAGSISPGSGSMEGWKSATVINGQTPMAIGAQSVRATGRIDGINRDHVAELLAAAGGMFGALPRTYRRDTRPTCPPRPRRNCG